MDDVTADVGRLAEADGYDAPNIVADLAGGKDYDFHFNEVGTNPSNNVAHAAITGDTWDYVVMQGFSTESTSIRNPDFATDALALYGSVLNHSSGHGAGATGVLFQTWARGPGHSFYPATFSSPTAMQAEVRDGYEAALTAIEGAYGDNAARIAPVGDAFESTNFDIGLYASDIYHANITGSLLASMVIYRTIYDETVSDIDYASVSDWAGVNETTWGELATVADATLVPEPGSMSMIAIGLSLLLCRKRRWI